MKYNKQHRIPTLLGISLLMVFAALTANLFKKDEPALKEWPSNTELEVDGNGLVSWSPIGKGHE